MEKFVALTRERHWENARWTDYYLFTADGNPEDAFRAAAREYLLTDSGNKAIKETSEDFNWGDAVMYVPSEIWNKHGIKELTDNDAVKVGGIVEITVNQDEVLIHKEYGNKDEDIS